MKGSHKKVNKRKISKVTLKHHSKNSHPSYQDGIKEATNGVVSVRPEEINFHQQ